MLQNVRGVSAERRERLIEVLDIEPSWRLHQVSDGQRRRVQIAMGLLHEFKVGGGVGRKGGDCVPFSDCATCGSQQDTPLPGSNPPTGPAPRRDHGGSGRAGSIQSAGLSQGGDRDAGLLCYLCTRLRHRKHWRTEDAQLHKSGVDSGSNAALHQTIHFLLSSIHPQATHIFDGLDDWPTHVAYLSGGEAKICAPVAEVPSLKDAPRLLEWVEGCVVMKGLGAWVYDLA